MQQFRDLGSRILSAPNMSAPEGISGSPDTLAGQSSISDDELRNLIRTAEMGSPSLRYLIGLAYLKGMAQISVEQEPRLQPREGEF